MSDDRHRVGSQVSGWIEAEQAGRLDEAEAGLAGMFAACAPPLSPPDAFADAVVSRAMRAYHPSIAWFGVPVRLLIVCSMVLMGLPIALFTGVSLFDLLLGPGPRLASAVARLLALTGSVVSAAGAAWSVAATVGEAVLAACSTGPAPLVLFLNILLAVAGYVGLRRLLAPAKECW
jgi:hypothetical protein